VIEIKGEFWGVGCRRDTCEEPHFLLNTNRRLDSLCVFYHTKEQALEYCLEEGEIPIRVEIVVRELED
jgi:hypothetical protein